ncbi:hypothetical protein K493DRAFT_407205 [Basidiobolus meristosporus CBS 931.73]|uniref:Arrestin C-terminal-like domain-containing protein n=1 Tax=Basidiobolus meristosporus CBS 931.73 TaxID=1314790 RepID=A0A1Y1YEQ4_9FUNG|nr:hypothetical protein K493DRAFT_407205 [Basidiobolus meristosporus CBS 931.73]|eukprot:ORX96520.1 hypothetical protein K493DRAFT_407205 [Basidiobolus meristosporus CBS 931.73]
MNRFLGVKLDIQLSEDCLILHGSRNESVGSVLRGSVVLHIKKEVCVSFMTLKLKGKTEILWPKTFAGNVLTSYERQNLVLYHWNLLPIEEGPFTLAPGEHRYSFEFIFNGFLPETIRIKNGLVKYKLVAVMGRNTLRPNLVSEKELVVRRFAQPSLLDINQTYPIVDTWENMLDYTIFISHRMIALSDSLSVFLTFLPKGPEIKVKHITFFLLEFLTLRRTKSNKRQVNTRWFSLRSRIEEPRTSYNRSYSVSFPREHEEKVHFDCNTELIEITHKLQVRVTFSAGKSVNAIVVKVPIHIMPESFEMMGESPPCYEQLPVMNLPSISPPPYH